ncbi:hypothetical protein B0H11DRAFT_2220035 [Mycena galericulata]|nr:hypothetical protein B0H11DRAFT_2220035 [Mycena galericulata]
MPQPPLLIHPWLNGAAEFDLAPSRFALRRLVPPHSPQSAPLRETEVRAQIGEQAFYPPVKLLRILLPKLPFWSIDLVPQNIPGSQRVAPISLSDVLWEIHRALHQKISAEDWATLSAENAHRVTQAFVQRCRAEAERSGVSPAHLRDREIAERSQGVKRVDFLLGKTVFKALVRSPADPEGCVRLKTVSASPLHVN